MSAPSVLDVAIVVESAFGDRGARERGHLLYQAESRVPFSPEHLARHAFRVFGKGRHAAALNFGDCFSYALSRSTGEPLLFKGEDFSRTDVAPCLLP
jgi:ribonuclease VapC